MPLIVQGADQEAAAPLVPVLCPSCAEADQDLRASPGRGLNRAAILISVGLFVLALSVLADLLAFGSGEGFGWKQILGFGIAGVLVLTGAMVRIPTLLVIGLIIGSLSVLADWLGFGNVEGFWWQQILGSLLGLLLIAAGITLARRRAYAARPGIPR